MEQAYDVPNETRRQFLSKSDSEKLNDLFDLIKGFRESAVRRLDDDDRVERMGINTLAVRFPFPAKDAINDLFEQAVKIMSS